jgi:hypothetical protein
VRRQQLENIGLAAIALAIVISGFFIGRAIGDAKEDDPGPGSVPSRIVTRAAVPAAPTLGEKGDIPPLQTTTRAAEQETEEEATSASTSEEVAEEPAPTPTPEPSPEVTVAPNR